MRVRACARRRRRRRTSTLEEVSAEASRKVMPRSAAYALPCSVDTARCCDRSVLLPTSIIVMSAVAFSLSSANHLSTFSNEFSFVMSYTTRAPTAQRAAHRQSEG